MFFYPIFLAAGLAFAVFMLCWDARLTEKGCKSGVAVECNGLIVWFFGLKPTCAQILRLEIPIRLAFFAIAFIPSPDYPHALMFTSAVMLFTYGVKGYLTGVRAWIRLGVTLTHGRKVVNENQ